MYPLLSVKEHEITVKKQLITPQLAPSLPADSTRNARLLPTSLRYAHSIHTNSAQQIHYI